jgi:hypothetical protein
MPLNPEAFAEMVVLTVQAAMAPLLERVAATEQKNIELQARVTELVELRDRVTVMEVKTAAPPTTGPTPAEMELSLRDRTEPLTKQIAGLSERIAVLEVRAPVAGPAGADGKDGIVGKDGADGLGFDDLMAEQTDERSFTIKAQRGDRIKAIGTVRFPVPIQQGVYQNGKAYEKGDLVTWDGSQWNCEAETTTDRPGEGSKAWKLVVKRGRDGKDGRDAVTVPVVSIGGAR